MDHVELREGSRVALLVPGSLDYVDLAMSLLAAGMFPIPLDPREDLIISGGVNVYPLEVENALRELDGVVDVAVFGRPDDEWGQRVCAAVVGEVDEDALVAHVRERLSPAKRPKAWLLVDELPRTLTGKVRRQLLAGIDGSEGLGLGDGSGPGTAVTTPE